MVTTWDVASEGFHDFVEFLANLSGRDYEPVLVNQVGALLRVAMRYTRAAKRETLIKRASSKANHVEFPDGSIVSFWKKAGVEMFLDVSNFKPKKGQAPPRLVNGKTWHDMDSRRWSDARWGRYVALHAIAEEKRRQAEQIPAARGLTKQSWNQIAQDLSIDIGAPGYVKKAVPSDGNTYKNGTARKMLEGASAYIEISNSNPILVKKLDGRTLLERAIAARLKSFQHEIRHGVFDDLAYRAKRYPGIFVAPSS